MERAVAWLGALGLLLAACGGRYEQHSGDPERSRGGSDGSGSAGGTASAGAGSSVEPFLIGSDGAARPTTFESPGWTEFEWSAETDEVPTSICEQGWNFDEAIAALKEQQPLVEGTRLIDGAELGAILAEMRGSDGTLRDLEPVLHAFALPDGELGAVRIGVSGHVLTIYYLRVTHDCAVEILATYSVDPDAAGCPFDPGLQLWGIPGSIPNVSDCHTSNGMYSFNAVVLEDSCGATAPQFVGTLGFKQQDSYSGVMWFPDLGGHPAGNPGYSMIIKDGVASSLALACGGACECQHGQTAVILEAGGTLTINEEHDVCDDTGQHVCSWRMQSGPIYGPL